MSCCLKKAWKSLFSHRKKGKDSCTPSERSSQQDFSILGRHRKEDKDSYTPSERSNQQDSNVLDRHSKLSISEVSTVNEAEDIATTQNILVHAPATVEIFDETFETQSLDSCLECSFERAIELTESSSDDLLLTNENQRLETNEDQRLEPYEDQRLEPNEDHSIAASADSLYSDISDPFLSYPQDSYEFLSFNNNFDIDEGDHDGTNSDESKDYGEIQQSVKNIHITENGLSNIEDIRDHICKIHMPASEMDFTDRKCNPCYVPKPLGHAKRIASGLVAKRKWESIGPRTVMEKLAEKYRTTDSGSPFLRDCAPGNYIRETLGTNISARTLNQSIPPTAKVKPQLRHNVTDPVESWEEECILDTFDLHHKDQTYVFFHGDDMPFFEVSFPKFSELKLTMPKWYHSESEEKDAVAFSEKDPLDSQYLCDSYKRAQPNFQSSENEYISSQLSHGKEKSKSCKNTKLTEDLASQSSSCEEMTSQKKDKEHQEINSRKFAEDCIQEKNTKDMLKEVILNQSPKEMFIQEKVPSSVSSQGKCEIHEVKDEKAPIIKDLKDYNNEPLFCNKSSITSSLKDDNHSSWKRQTSEIYKDQVNHDMDSLSISDAPTSYCEPTCLYDHDGEICIIEKVRYIKAYITSFKKLIFVHVKKREMAGGWAVGCHILWHGQTPIPLSTTTNGQKVKFDAILLPDDNKFQAVIIWDQIKPKYAMEPSTRSYILLDSQVLTCKGFVGQNGVKQVTVCYNGTLVFADILNGANLVDKTPRDFSFLKFYLNTSMKTSNTVSCKVSRLMSARSGQCIKYVCSSIWIGKCPTKEVQKRDFERDKIYRTSPNHTFIADKVPCCMYVDLPSQLKNTGVYMALEFRIGSSKVTIPVTYDKLYSENGNYRVDSSHPLDAPVKAHVLRVSESKWHIVMVQLIQRNLSEEASTSSHLPLHEAERNLCTEASIFSHKSLPGERPSKSIECANNMQHSKVLLEKLENQVESVSAKEYESDHKLNHAAQCNTKQRRIIPENNQVCTTKNHSTSKASSVKSNSALQSNSAKKTVEFRENTVKNGKEISSKPFVPNSLKNVTGKVINTVGDFGILEVKNRHIQGNGIAYASFHKSVAYVNRWPLYRDMFLSEQIERLTCKEWHCNLEKDSWTLRDINITFRATIVWQGVKPTQENLQFFMNLPSDSSSLYYYDYKVINDNSNDFFHSSIYNKLQKQCKSSSPHPKVKGKRGSSMHSKGTNVVDDLEALSMDDMDLLPTLASDPLKETVDV